MGLFLWDSEPSKIFVGDTEVSSVWVWANKVRPTTLVHISTDLRQCSSEADVIAQWWGGIAKYNTWNYTLANGNWIELTSWHNFVCSLYYPLTTPLTTSNKVTMHCTGNWRNWSYSWGERMYLSTATWDAGWTWACLAFYATETGIRIDNDISDITHWNGYWDFDITMVVDLSTWVITYTWTAASGNYKTINLTRTMTAAQIQNAISKSYLTFETICYSFYAHKLYTAEIKIE